MNKRFFLLILMILCYGCNSLKKSKHCNMWVKRIYDSDIERIEKHPSIVQFKNKKTNLIGFKEKGGKVLIPAIYTNAFDFNKYGVADVCNRFWYKVDKSGKFLVKSYVFDNGPDYYISGLSRFEKNGKLGFVDFQGKIIIPAQFDWVTPLIFSKPIAIVCVGCVLTKKHKNDEYPIMDSGKWGAIDKNGNIVISLDFTGYKIDQGDDLLLLKKDVPYKLCQNDDGVFQPIKQCSLWCN